MVTFLALKFDYLLCFHDGEQLISFPRINEMGENK